VKEFYGFALKKQLQGGEQKMYEVNVDKDKCIGCGECVDICPVEVYEMQDEKSVPVNAEECVGCESCIEVCEQEAITVGEVGSAAA
jgi:NAD-dependent dihydropyrimidine dehydrogenase PreA subunit